MKGLPCAIVAAAAVTAAMSVTTFAAGPDVLYSGINSQMNHGNVGGIRAYTLGTNTCNIGNQNLLWTNDGTPGVGFNAYRLHDGRLTQLGLSFVKTACCAAAGSGCGMACNGQGGSVLGAGCLDVYSASWNSNQSALAARSSINAYTGAFSPFSTATGNAIFKRLQVQQTEITLANFPGATFFVEGVYVGSDDAASNNRNNNASYRPATVNQTSFDFSLTSSTFAGLPAITAWRTHGLGLNTADTSVNLASLDVPSEGRFHYAYKVRDNLDGTWRYEYAIFNLSSDRSGGSFSIPVPAGTVITNTGFSSPDYHSGEPYSNADWVVTTTGGSVTWATPQTFAENANSSALRWGTMYNFWFDANRGPGNVVATLGLFKPHTPQSVTLTVSGPILDCVADINGTASVDIDDLLMVIEAWGACVDPKNCPADIAPQGGNDIVDIDDLLTVIGAWGPCP